MTDRPTQDDWNDTYHWMICANHHSTLDTIRAWLALWKPTLRFEVWMQSKESMGNMACCVSVSTDLTWPGRSLEPLFQFALRQGCVLRCVGNSERGQIIRDHLGFHWWGNDENRPVCPRDTDD